MDLQRKKLYLLDMDGTLYLGDQLFDCTPDFLDTVRQHCATIRYLTNNSSRSAADYVAKLERLGIAAEPSDFLTSVDASIDVLRREYQDAVLYVCGTESLKTQLRAAGISVVDQPSADVTCLLCGFDTELTFQKLEDACRLLGRGVNYIATNPDWVCPTEYGFVPDCGAVCEMLWRATGRRPRVIGKPQPDMVQLAMIDCGVSAEETILVGDRLYTDIQAGVNAGVDTVLVLSGESSIETVAESEVKPTAVMRDVGEITDNLKRIRLR